MMMTLLSLPRSLVACYLLGLLWASGCDSPAAISPATPSMAAQSDPPERHSRAKGPAADGAPAVAQQPLDAETLADLLGVEAWRFHYAGGSAHCWLEIEEVGQETMPPRLPEDRSLQLDQPSGQIVLSWRRTLSGYAGGAIRLQGGGTVYGLDLNSRSFIYGWEGSRVTCTPQGKQRPVTGDEGDEVVLMTYHARETVAEGASPREVRLTLKLRWGLPQR